MIQVVQLFVLSCFLSTSVCSGALAQTGKLNEEKKFGEDLILKMTEPPERPATPSSVDFTPTSSAVKQSTTPTPSSTPTTEQPATDKIDNSAPSSSTVIGLDATRPARVLNGRIEQLINTQQPAFPFGPDGASAALKKAAANEEMLTSYPAALRGIWVGIATVDENSYSEFFELKGPVLVSRERAILFPGRTGELSVIFEPDSSGLIKDVRAKIGFTPTKDDLPYLDMVLKPTSGADPLKPVSIPATLRYSVDFGSRTGGRSVTGVRSDRTEVSNRILRLSSTVTEQMIGVQVKSIDPTTKQIGTSWTETVIKLQSFSATQMLVHIASVRYAGNGLYLCKQIFHGTISRIAGSDVAPMK